MNKVYDFMELSFRELIFPIERPKHTANFTDFYLKFDAYTQGITIFEFQAVQNGQLENQILVQISHNSFIVPHRRYGNIYFGASLISDTSEYIGSSARVKKSEKFIRIFPLDNDELNFLCEFKKFFFVGFVDRDIDKPYEESY